VAACLRLHADAHYITSPLLAKAAAPFTVSLFDGRQVSLNELRGKAIFLNFWASCAFPCPPKRRISKRLAAPQRQNMVFSGSHPGQGERISCVSSRIQHHLCQRLDESGKIAVDFGVWGIPESFFIDPQGRITTSMLAGIRAALVTAKLEEASPRHTLVAKEGKEDYQPIR